MLVSINKGKHYNAACLSLNRLRYGTDTVSKLVEVYDPTYLEVLVLFQEVFEELEKYTLNQENKNCMN